MTMFSISFSNSGSSLLIVLKAVSNFKKDRLITIRPFVGFTLNATIWSYKINLNDTSRATDFDILLISLKLTLVL